MCPLFVTAFGSLIGPVVVLCYSIKNIGVHGMVVLSTFYNCCTGLTWGILS